jgi:hypothetical protein
MIYTSQKSKLSKKQKEKRKALLKEQREVKKQLKTEMRSKRLSGGPTVPTDRSNRHLPSVDDGRGDCTLRAAPRYTGDAVVGVAVLHKSCLQPVFSKEAAEDAAKMRR